MLLVLTCFSVASSTPLTAIFRSSPLLKMDWTLNDTHITATVTADQAGWVGVAVSPNGHMVGSDAVVGGWNNEVKEYYLGGMSPSLITAYSAQSLTATSLQSTGGNVVMTFTRLILPPSSSSSSPMQTWEGQQKVLIAVGSSQQKVKHTYANSVMTFNFNQSTVINVPVYPPVLIGVAAVAIAILFTVLRKTPIVNTIGTAIVVIFGAAIVVVIIAVISAEGGFPKEGIYSLHPIFMSFSYALFMSYGVCMYKMGYHIAAKPSRRPIHRWMQILSAVCAVVGLAGICQAKIESAMRGSTESILPQSFHSWLGTVSLFGLIFQVLIGMRKEAYHNSNAPRYKFHGYIGIITVVSGVVNIAVAAGVGYISPDYSVQMLMIALSCLLSATLLIWWVLGLAKAPGLTSPHNYDKPLSSLSRS